MNFLLVNGFVVKITSTVENAISVCMVREQWCQVLLNLTNSVKYTHIAAFIQGFIKVWNLLFEVAGYISYLATILVRYRVVGIAWPINNDFPVFGPVSIGFPDLRHICQNLNQFGHGRGTIYGGNKVAFCTCKFTNTVTWTVNKNIWEQFIGCLFLQGLPSIPLFQLAIVINWRQISMLTRPAYWNVRDLMCKSLAWDLRTHCVYNIR